MTIHIHGEKLMNDKANYIQFYHNHFNYYQDIENIADVAVIHSFATMAYNNNRPYQSTYLFEQTLIQEKIPFDIIYDEHLKDLSKYKVLVLADQECLSDEALELIRKFVQSGGGLVATEHTSLYTDRRLRKIDFGLKDLFQTEAPQWIGGRSPLEPILNVPVLKNRVGSGRVVYIPEVKPVIEKRPASPMYNQYWLLPVNWEEITESVKWAAGNDLALEIQAPQTVAMELHQQKNTRYLMLHLLNYNVEKQPQVRNIKVGIKIPNKKEFTQVVLFSPDGNSNENLDFTRIGDKIQFKVPSLHVYNMVVIK